MKKIAFILFSMSLFISETPVFANDVCGAIVRISQNCVTPWGADCNFGLKSRGEKNPLALVSGSIMVTKLLSDNLNKFAIISLAYAESGDNLATAVRPVRNCR